MMVKLPLCLTDSALPHKGMWGSGYRDPRFLDQGTSWRRVVSFTPLPLYPREKSSGTHCIERWVGLKAGINDMEKWEFFTLPGLELRPLGRPARSHYYTDYATTVLLLILALFNFLRDEYIMYFHAHRGWSVNAKTGVRSVRLCISTVFCYWVLHLFYLYFFFVCLFVCSSGYFIFLLSITFLQQYLKYFAPVLSTITFLLLF
jgi:hypothetical protein